MISPGSADKVMHASLRAGDATILMSDGRCTGSTNFHGIALALSVASDAEAERIFNALADGGKVNMPMAKTFFSSRFGMLSDKFGVGWMVLVGHCNAKRRGRVNCGVSMLAECQERRLRHLARVRCATRPDVAGASPSRSA